MAEFLGRLDPSKLVLAETVLSFVVAPFVAPPYNLAIFLFGTYAVENTEAVQSLQTFTGLVGASAIFDMVFMARQEQNWFIKLITILILIIKIPTFFAFGHAMSQGGSLGALGINGGDLTGATVWSMPGGYTSSGREGYQTVNDDRPSPALNPSVPQAPPPAAPAPNAYQSV